MKASLPIIASLVLVSGCTAMQELNPFASALSGFDKDEDGVISQQEAKSSSSLSENFSRVDTNRSGGISSEEYEAATMHLADLDFEEVDINGDNVISKREAAAMPVSLEEAFDTVDTDGDGNVSQVEYEAGRTNLLKGVDFDSVDTDGDGVIDPQEAGNMSALSGAFERVDTDADGLIGEDEYKAAQR